MLYDLNQVFDMSRNPSKMYRDRQIQVPNGRLRDSYKVVVEEVTLLV